MNRSTCLSIPRQNVRPTRHYHPQPHPARVQRQPDSEHRPNSAPESVPVMHLGAKHRPLHVRTPQQFLHDSDASSPILQMDQNGQDILNTQLALMPSPTAPAEPPDSVCGCHFSPGRRRPQSDAMLHRPQQCGFRVYKDTRALSYTSPVVAHQYRLHLKPTSATVGYLIPQQTAGGEVDSRVP